MRVERIGAATLYQADCLAVRPLLERVDAVITDPPYGQRERVKRASAGRGYNRDGHPKQRNRPAKDHQEIAGDDKPFDPSPWLTYKRVVLWGANHYADKLPPGKTRWLIWDKRCGKGNDDNADCELAWTNLKGVDRIHRQLWRGFCREGMDNAARGVLHPMQKPVELMRWCLEQAGVVAGMVVFDPYMGSAPVGIACAQLDAIYIGAEDVPHYFDLACERVRDGQRQRMFA